GPATHQPAAVRNGGPAQFHCFRVVIYYESCNSNVSARRGRMCHPICHPPCVTIRRHPICHHPSSSHLPPSLDIIFLHFEAHMQSRRIHITTSNPPPGPRPR